jgi:hypothetical protein
MATKNTSREDKFAIDLYGDLPTYKEANFQAPNVDKINDIQDEVRDIYSQAKKHRDLLLKFFIWYTILFSVFVIGIMIWQATIRQVLRQDDFEIMSQWALNILITGMFAQFIGLLTIVTKKVWDFEPFFKHSENGEAGDR